MEYVYDKLFVLKRKPPPPSNTQTENVTAKKCKAEKGILCM